MRGAEAPRAIFRGEEGRFRRAVGPVAVLEARTDADVVPVLDEVDAACRGGLTACGFVAYEAAPAFDPALDTHPPLPGLPLAWFLLFRGVEEETLPPGGGESPPFSPDAGKERFVEAVERIRHLIARGECYQVNHTISCSAPLAGDPLPLFGRLAASQPTPYAAFLDTGRFALLSLSPELFFSREGDRVVTRPMKGTRRRGRFPTEDDAIGRGLAADPKERAENLMIVDLLRNDLSRVALPGTVTVDSLFDVETLPTLFQMTSTVSGEVDPRIPLSRLFGALFPCGSVTGAPKRRAMEIIRSLESGPRGVYCGAIGVVHPGGGCRFSVPIRTILVDRANGVATLGVGSGITWGSDAAAEWDEVRGKSLFSAPHRLGLIESLRREGGGYPLLRHHLARLSWSAGRLGIPLGEERIRTLLESLPVVAPVAKVRLHLAPDGGVSVEQQEIRDDPAPLRIVIGGERVDSRDESLFHKCDDRRRFDDTLRRHPGVDDVILLNQRGEVTQGCWNSLVVRLDGVDCTPPLSAGLLPGVMRGVLLERGEIVERPLIPGDLARSEGIWLINAVRGRRAATLT